MSFRFLTPFWLLVIAPNLSGAGVDASAAFDAANKLYEQGQYGQAAVAYQGLTQTGTTSATVYFNLGNAWFKAGQTGRAIAAWRLGESLAPRDPSIRFNLNFARKRVSGTDGQLVPAWQRALCSLTLNEWCALASVALWLWFGLLSCRELRPLLRRALQGYTATAGILVLLLAACVAGAANLQFNTVSAVVIVPEAIVRSGPLDEAKVLHQFRDGVEVTSLDTKELTGDGQKQTWHQVRDSLKRTGWVKSDQLAIIPPR